MYACLVLNNEINDYRAVYKVMDLNYWSVLRRFFITDPT